ncbi:MAG: glutathione S-transferase family protein [Gammaproteobacteria bacterium]|nr:glutathione S-transferase family protein [Gammaproteobacteria bacterium]
MEIELYYAPHTRSLRPRWLLEEMDIPYTIRPVDLFGGERNPLHPLGSVPAIRVDGVSMFESGAMCHWLADRFPEKRLAPAVEDVLRPAYEQWMFFAPGTLEPPAFEILLHTRILPEKHRVSEIVGFAEQGYRRVLHYLATQLDHDGYLLGTSFSCADIMIGTTLDWLPDMLEPHPALQAYVQRITSREAYARATQPV